MSSERAAKCLDAGSNAFRTVRSEDDGSGDGVGPKDIFFGDLGYAREARVSYQDFLAAREAGHLPQNVRFMVALPTPYAVLQTFLEPDAVKMVEPAYTAAMINEVERI
jgi:hypothetical protein